MSNQTTECPHGIPAQRECGGCDSIEGDVRWCEGEISGHAYADSEGDAGVIGGTNDFVAVEDLELSCGCILNGQEEQAVIDKLAESAVEAWSEPYDDD